MNWEAFFAALGMFGGLVIALCALIVLLDWIERRYSLVASVFAGLALIVLTLATTVGVLAA